MESDFGTPVSWSHWSRSSKLNHDQNLVKEKTWSPTHITSSAWFFPQYTPFARHFQPCSGPAWRLLIGTLSCWFTDFQFNILRQWEVGNTNLHMIGKVRQTLPRQPTLQPTTSRQPTCCRASRRIPLSDTYSFDLSFPSIPPWWLWDSTLSFDWPVPRNSLSFCKFLPK